MNCSIFRSSAVKSAALAVMLASGAVAGHAQELKIGYVNSDRVLRDATPAKAAQVKLEGEFSKREKELADLAARLRPPEKNSTRMHRPWPRPSAAGANAIWSNRTEISSAAAASSRKI